MLKIAASTKLFLSIGLLLGVQAQSPTVKLDNGTFLGTSSGDVSKFLGIPFAQPPWVMNDSLCKHLWQDQLSLNFRVGNLRFNLPQPVALYSGTHNATSFGPSCPQLGVTPGSSDGLPPATATLLAEIGALSFVAANATSEDCMLFSACPNTVS